METLKKVLIVNSDASKIKEWDNKYQLGFCIDNINEGLKECKVTRIRENHINIAELKGMIYALEYVLFNIGNIQGYNIHLYSDNMFVAILLKECHKQISLLSEEGKYTLMKHEIFKPNRKKVNCEEFIRLSDSLKKQKFRQINYVMKLLLLISEGNHVSIKWIPRRENHTADKLSKLGPKHYESYALNEESEVEVL